MLCIACWARRGALSRRRRRRRTLSFSRRPDRAKRRKSVCYHAITTPIKGKSHWIIKSWCPLHLNLGINLDGAFLEMASKYSSSAVGQRFDLGFEKENRGLKFDRLWNQEDLSGLKLTRYLLCRTNKRRESLITSRPSAGRVGTTTHFVYLSNRVNFWQTLMMEMNFSYSPFVEISQKRATELVN